MNDGFPIRRTRLNVIDKKLNVVLRSHYPKAITINGYEVFISDSGAGGTRFSWYRLREFDFDSHKFPAFVAV